jgi:glycosyltransferase involved in cell wall biosynthesis
LRILFLAPQPFFEVRGTPLAVLAMVRALSACGHEVDLLTFAQGEDIAVPGVVHRRSLALPVGRVKPGASAAKMILDIPFIGHAKWRLVVGRYDVVHAVEEAAHLIAPMARVLRVPLVADVDSSIPHQLRYSGFARRGPLLWLAEGLERFALRGAVAAITVCRSLTEVVRATAPGTPVFQIEDPPLVTGASTDSETIGALRSRLRLGSLPVVLYTGNLESYQGVDLLIDAAARVEGASFLIVGGRPDEVVAMRGRAQTAGVADRIVFAGAQPPSELPLYLGLADILVSPRIEGTNTPFKLYTYMASGKPVVATRIESHTQVLGDDTAFLADPTAESLASAIREAVLHPAVAAARAASARALASREYSAERYLEKVRAAYDEITRLVAAR